MEQLKNIINKSQIIFLILLSLFVYSCDSVEEDTYVTTVLNGLYRYKSLYATKTCDEADDFYGDDISDEKIQPYFIFEGRKGLDEGINDLLLYYCEDRRFSTCDKEHEYLFAKGANENWTFEAPITAKYDYIRKTCIFTRNVVKESSFRDEKLEIKTKFYSYEDSELSSGDCKLKNINYSELRCNKKKKYSMIRELISERDQKYFEEQAKKEDNQN